MAARYGSGSRGTGVTGSFLDAAGKAARSWSLRVATRFASAAVLLTALLLAALVYNISQVTRLAGLHHELAETQLRAAKLSVDLGRQLSDLDEFTRKLFVLRDAEYAERIVELEATFGEHLGELEALELAPEVRAETQRLTELWSELPPTALTRSLLDSDLDPEAEELLLSAFAEHSGRLRQQSQAVASANQEAVGQQVSRALAASDRTRTLTWIVALVAVVASAFVLGWAVSSLRQPLRRLAAGTRSVAEGELSFRVDTRQQDEFAALGSSFNEMVRRLSERDTEKRELVNKLSHDLKTPLAAMEETSRLLLHEQPGPLTGDQRRLLELNLEATRRLSAMIAKLLEMARVEVRTAHYDVQRHDLGRIATQVAAAFSARARESDLRLEVECADTPVEADCDRERILQLISNLVENALKFSPPGGRIVIRVHDGPPPEGFDDPSAARPTAGPVGLIEVVDAGPGVPEAEKRKIFDKYHQVRDLRRRGEGIGLGLAICREIASAHRGRIWVSDRPEGGSVFSLALPLAAERPAGLKVEGAA